MESTMKNWNSVRHATILTMILFGTWVPFFHNLGLVVDICMPICTTMPIAYFLYVTVSGKSKAVGKNAA